MGHLGDEHTTISDPLRKTPFHVSPSAPPSLTCGPINDLTFTGAFILYSKIWKWSNMFSFASDIIHSQG